MASKLKIFGKEYTIEGEDVSPDYMRKVAGYVDSKIGELSQSSQSSFDIVVLAALNIADELFQERESHNEEKLIIERTIALLEDGLSQI